MGRVIWVAPKPLRTYGLSINRGQPTCQRKPACKMQAHKCKHTPANRAKTLQGARKGIVGKQSVNHSHHRGGGRGLLHVWDERERKGGPRTAWPRLLCDGLGQRDPHLAVVSWSGPSWLGEGLLQKKWTQKRGDVPGKMIFKKMQSEWEGGQKKEKPGGRSSPSISDLSGTA